MRAPCRLIRKVICRTVRDEADPYEASIGILRMGIEKPESCYEFAEGDFKGRVAYEQILDGDAPAAPYLDWARPQFDGDV
jgi:hypothetical protein